MIRIREFEIRNNVLFKYGGSARDVKIPENITEIKRAAFAKCDFIESVTLPDSVLAIREYAFAYCDNLTSVNIPSSVFSIDAFAFANCKGLKELHLPRSVEDIGYKAFDGCDGLTLLSYKNTYAEKYALKHNIPFVAKDEAELAAGFEIVDGELVKYHGNDYEVTVPRTVKRIGDSAFMCNYAIRSVTIPDTVTHIGYRAFTACTNLKEVNLPATLEGIANMAFASCKALKALDLPHSVRSIGFCAFTCCNTLKTVTLRSSSVSIAPCAFDSCKELTLCAQKGSAAHSYALANRINFASFDGERDDYAGVWEDYGKFEIVEGRLVEYSGDDADIVIPTSVTYIERFAFLCCSEVRSITFHAGITHIEDGALNVFNSDETKMYSSPGSYSDRYVKEWCKK